MSPISKTLRDQLLKQASTARLQAYAPYSNYWVGAALLAENGQIFTGCNVENAASPAGICAERTAIVKAISEGVRTFQAVAVVTSDGGTPCGICRQTLNEFAPEIWVIIARADGEILHELPLSDLLPRSFGPANLLNA